MKAKILVTTCAALIGAFVLSSAQAQTPQQRMKECATEWSGLKAAKNTEGKTYRDFQKECLAKGTSTQPPAGQTATPAATTPPAAPPAAREASPRGEGARRANAGHRTIQVRSGGKRPLPGRHRGVGQSQFEDLSLQRKQVVRHDQERRLHVREGDHERRLPRLEDRKEEDVSNVRARPIRLAAILRGHAHLSAEA